MKTVYSPFPCSNKAITQSSIEKSSDTELTMKIVSYNNLLRTTT